MDINIAPTFIQTIQSLANGLAFSTYRPLYSVAPPPVVTTNLPFYTTVIGAANAPVNPNNTPQPNNRQTYVVRSWYNDPVNFVWDAKARLYRGFALSSNVYGSPNGYETTWQELVSPDMISWTPTRFLFNIPQGAHDLWGGSYFVDTEGAAGFSPGAVLYFISRPNSDIDQRQCISLWVAPYLGAAPMFVKYILYSPPIGVNGMRPYSGFRDMRVVKNPDGTGWIAGITIDYGIAFYASTNLIDWSFVGVIDLSEYQQIECPSPVEVKDSFGNSKWFLFFGMKTYKGAYQQCVSYIPVTWTGTTFTPDTTIPTIINWGHDYYAQALSARDDSRYMWGWVGDWNYQGTLFAQGFCGVVSNVTELYLKNKEDGSPGVGVKFLQNQTQKYQASTMLVPYGAYPIFEQYVWKAAIPTPGISWRVDATLSPNTQYPWPDKVHFDFCVAANANYQSDTGFDRTRLTFNFKNGTVSLDRSRCGNRPTNLADVNQQALWDIVREAPLPPRARYQFTVIFDVCFVEIIINDGDVYITSLTMPAFPADRDMYITAEGAGQAGLTRFTFKN